MFSSVFCFCVKMQRIVRKTLGEIEKGGEHGSGRHGRDILCFVYDMGFL